MRCLHTCIIRGPLYSVCRATGLPAGLLLRQNETADPSVDQALEIARAELSTSILRVEYFADRLGKIGYRNRLMCVLRVPGFEQLNLVETVWIARLDRVDPFDRIASA